MFPWPSLLSRSKKGAENFPQGGRNFVPLMNCPQIWGLLKIKHSPEPGSKKPHAHEWAQGIDKMRICGYTENRKGAAGKRVAP